MIKLFCLCTGCSENKSLFFGGGGGGEVALQEYMFKEMCVSSHQIFVLLYVCQ